MESQIIDDTNAVIHKGETSEMEKAFEYMTTEGWKLAEKHGYSVQDLYDLNKKYWTTFVGTLRLQKC